MIGSKLLPFLRMGFRQGSPVAGRLISTSTKRLSDAPWTYREFTPASKKIELWANVAGAFFWWWVFWHLFTDYGHLIGEADFPDISKWTDEELGIPPDDAEDPE